MTTTLTPKEAARQDVWTGQCLTQAFTLATQMEARLGELRDLEGSSFKFDVRRFDEATGAEVPNDEASVQRDIEDRRRFTYTITTNLEPATFAGKKMADEKQASMTIDFDDRNGQQLPHMRLNFNGELLGGLVIPDMAVPRVATLAARQKKIPTF